MRFMSPEMAEKFLQSHFCKSLSTLLVFSMYKNHEIFAVEDELCQRIQKLQHYRENGITTFKGKEASRLLVCQNKKLKRLKYTP